MILQPGDRVSLHYHISSVAERESREQIERRLAAARRDVRPVIGRLPFDVDPEHGFNKWIVNYLPVKNPGP